MAGKVAIYVLAIIIVALLFPMALALVVILFPLLKGWLNN